MIRIEFFLTLFFQTQDLSKTRESLVAAETSQVHLQQRADDLSRQLEASLEKLSVYERRPSATTSSLVPSVEGRSREEILEAEVAELKYVSTLMVNHFS